MKKKWVPAIVRPTNNDADAVALLNGKVEFVERETRDLANTFAALIRRRGKVMGLQVKPAVRTKGGKIMVYVETF